MNIDQREMPVLGKWVVKYDDVYQMPQFVQGKLIGDFEELSNGQTIIVRDVESIDMRDKVLKTSGGFEYKLVGRGQRMVLLDEGEFAQTTILDQDESELLNE